MNAPARTLASPYARRLARERGVALGSLVGSGPNGRIVAADLARAVIAPPVEIPAAAPPAAVVAAAALPARQISAFAVTIDLEPLAAFIAACGTGLPIDAFLVKAAARAAGDRAQAIRWVKPEGGAVTIPRAVALAPTEIARLLATEPDTADSGKAFVLSRLVGKGVRPVAGSLPADADLRLLVIGADDAATVEGLLVHDAEAVPEADAVSLLASLRDLIEVPLRLLV